MGYAEGGSQYLMQVCSEAVSSQSQISLRELSRVFHSFPSVFTHNRAFDEFTIQPDQDARSPSDIQAIARYLFPRMPFHYFVDTPEVKLKIETDFKQFTNDYNDGHRQLAPSRSRWYGCQKNENEKNATVCMYAPGQSAIKELYQFLGYYGMLVEKAEQNIEARNVIEHEIRRHLEEYYPTHKDHFNAMVANFFNGNITIIRPEEKSYIPESAGSLLMKEAIRRLKDMEVVPSAILFANDFSLTGLLQTAQLNSTTKYYLDKHLSHKRKWKQVIHYLRKNKYPDVVKKAVYCAYIKRYKGPVEDLNLTKHIMNSERAEALLGIVELVKRSHSPTGDRLLFFSPEYMHHDIYENLPEELKEILDGMRTHKLSILFLPYAVGDLTEDIAREAINQFGSKLVLGEIGKIGAVLQDNVAFHDANKVVFPTEVFVPGKPEPIPLNNKAAELKYAEQRASILSALGVMAQALPDFVHMLKKGKYQPTVNMEHAFLAKFPEAVKIIIDYVSDHIDFRTSHTSDKHLSSSMGPVGTVAVMEATLLWLQEYVKYANQIEN